MKNIKNNKNKRIRGTNYNGPHGLPADLLDRLIIIRTQKYEEKEMNKILSLRCEEEEVQIEPAALELLTKIGVDTTLRYAMQLIQVANTLAQRNMSSTVLIGHIQAVYKMFAEEQRSAKLMKENPDNYMYNEEVGEDIHSMQFLGNRS